MSDDEIIEHLNEERKDSFKKALQAARADERTVLLESLKSEFEQMKNTLAAETEKQKAESEREKEEYMAKINAEIDNAFGEGYQKGQAEEKERHELDSSTISLLNMYGISYESSKEEPYTCRDGSAFSNGFEAFAHSYELKSQEIGSEAAASRPIEGISEDEYKARVKSILGEIYNATVSLIVADTDSNDKIFDYDKVIDKVKIKYAEKEIEVQPAKVKKGESS
jgi:hypothetical protein